MALKIAKKLDNGLDAPNAYTNIIEVRTGDRRGVSISVQTFTDKQSRDAGVGGIHSESHRFTFKRDEIVGEMTLYAWAYAKLKLLEQYQGAEDV